MLLKEGQKAKALNLKNQDGKLVKLGDFKGQNLVLYFYPKDLTPGCTTQACGFNDELKAFAKLNTQVIGVSFDDEKRHQKFIQKHDLKFDLLVDAKKEVANKYGVYQLKKFMGREFMGIVRSTFIIDATGTIRKIFSPVRVKNHIEEVKAALKELA